MTKNVSLADFGTMSANLPWRSRAARSKTPEMCQNPWIWFDKWMYPSWLFIITKGMIISNGKIKVSEVPPYWGNIRFCKKNMAGRHWIKHGWKSYPQEV